MSLFISINAGRLVGAGLCKALVALGRLRAGVAIALWELLLEAIWSFSAWPAN